METPHRLYVPRDLWSLIQEKSNTMIGKKPCDLALDGIRMVLTADEKTKKMTPSSLSAGKETENKNKRGRKKRLLYLYRGGGPEDFHWIEEAEDIDHMKKFFYNIRQQELFDKCIVTEKPEGMDLEILADYAERLWYEKQAHWEAQDGFH